MTARSAQEPRHIICKRVLGLEGDTVTVRPQTGTSQPYKTQASYSLK